MTSTEDLLEHLERECRPNGTTFAVAMRPEDILVMRQLAVRWDTHPVNVLTRALQLASELQKASSQGAEVIVRHPRRVRWQRTRTIDAAYKGPKNQ